jgi:hypothetical protein
VEIQRILQQLLNVSYQKGQSLLPVVGFAGDIK